MPVKILNFSELKKKLDASGSEPLDLIVKKVGITYVVAVTREKCPGCEKQKPLFEKLLNKMKEKYGNQVEFFRVHSAYSQEQKEEAKQCLDAFHTVAFPTYIVSVKDGEGNNRETYRSIEPFISEIERNIKTGMQIAEWFKPKNK
jgi:thiol-disulfide isomerase/thioredoxin